MPRRVRGVRDAQGCDGAIWKCNGLQLLSIGNSGYLGTAAVPKSNTRIAKANRCTEVDRSGREVRVYKQRWIGTLSRKYTAGQTDPTIEDAKVGHPLS